MRGGVGQSAARLRTLVAGLSCDRLFAQTFKASAMSRIVAYRKSSPGTQPEYFYPPYVSTTKRAPTRPLVLMPQTLSEVPGPLFGRDDLGAVDHDLTRQHLQPPIGERIIVSGRVLEENGRPV